MLVEESSDLLSQAAVNWVQMTAKFGMLKVGLTGRKFNGKSKQCHCLLASVYWK